ADALRLAKAFETAAGSAQDALHADVINRDDKIDAGGSRRLEESAEKLAGHRAQPVLQMPEQFGIGGEPAALQDTRAADDLFRLQQLAEDIGEHMRSGRRQETQACQDIAVLVDLDDIERI